MPDLLTSGCCDCDDDTMGFPANLSVDLAITEDTPTTPAGQLVIDCGNSTRQYGAGGSPCVFCPEPANPPSEQTFDCGTVVTAHDNSLIPLINGNYTLQRQAFDTGNPAGTCSVDYLMALRAMCNGTGNLRVQSAGSWPGDDLYSGRVRQCFDVTQGGDCDTADCQVNDEAQIATEFDGVWVEISVNIGVTCICSTVWSWGITGSVSVYFERKKATFTNIPLPPTACAYELLTDLSFSFVGSGTVVAARPEDVISLVLPNAPARMLTSAEAGDFLWQDGLCGACATDTGCVKDCILPPPAAPLWLGCTATGVAAFGTNANDLYMAYDGAELTLNAA